MKNTIVVAIVLIIIGSIVVYFLTRSTTVVVENPTEQDIGEKVDTQSTPQIAKDTTEVVEPMMNEKETIIGTSVGDRNIVAYHYGTGDTELLFVGGTHAGYSWNTVLVARELMSYLESNPTAIPENIKVTVIPTLNPDGLSKVIKTDGVFTKADVSIVQSELISGRFNGNNVDLNRNFDCDWQSEGTWQNTKVSGGSTVFSEPESQALRDYVTKHSIAGAVVWYSAAGGVFASNCHNGILPETKTIMDTYAKASGYKAYESFDFYEITGDLVNWLAKNSIPAISVLLTTHKDVEWDKNRAGIEALLTHYKK